MVALFSLVLPQTVNAQGWLWAKSAGGSGTESATAITTDRSGNVYATGYFTTSSFSFGFFPVNNTSGGSADVYLVKYDRSGTVLGAQSGGGTSNDYATSISADPSGYIYIAGYFFSSSVTFGGITLNNNGPSGTSDMYVVKYDSLGNVMWARSAGGSDNDRINSIKADAWGNVVMTGSFESPTLVFGPDTLRTLSTVDKAFVVKYDSAGSYQWSAGAGGTGYDFGNAITTDAATNVYVAGKFGSPTITFGDTVLTNTDPAANDMFLVKYSTTGTVQWARHSADSGNAMATCVSADVTGNVYVGGNFAGSSIKFGTTTLINSGGNDIFLTKYGSGGNVIWARANGGTADDIPHALVIDDSSNIILTGNFVSPTLHFDAYTVTYDGTGVSALFLAKYDGAGNVSWAKTTGASHGNANGVAFAPGQIFLAGDYSDTTFWFGLDTLHNAIHTGTSDIFVAKYSEGELFVTPVTAASHCMRVYPNPNNGSMIVSFEETGYDNIGIFDCTGKVIYQSILSGAEREVRINASDLNDGVYLLRSMHKGIAGSASFVIRR